MAPLLFLLAVVVIAVSALMYVTRRGNASALDDARADADHWYDLLGGQVLNLTASADETARQALSDASERYNAAGAQKATAHTAAEYRSVRDTALEGLYFIRAARTAMGFDPGPHLPPTTAQSQAGELRVAQQFVTRGGQTIEGRPQPTSNNRFYYPGGVVGGRRMPGGWYNQPFWKGALLGGAAGFGGSMLLGGLAEAIGGGFGDNDWGGGGDFGGGDFGGGDLGGGDFGGGDFGGGDW
jgi:hypothetical protein